MTARAYIRTFTDQTERCAELSDGEYRLLMVLTLLAAEQHPRGHYRSAEVLKAHTPARLRRHLTRLYDLRFLVLLPSGEVYVDGWDEDQEGDWKVAERMARHRARQRGGGPPTATPVTPPTVTAVTPPTVTPPYSSGTSRSIGSGSGSGTTPQILKGKPPIGGGRFSDAYKTYEHITGKKPDTKQQGFLDDLSGQFGMETVARALYAEPDYTEFGLLGRVARTLRAGRR